MTCSQSPLILLFVLILSNEFNERKREYNEFQRSYYLEVCKAERRDAYALTLSIPNKRKRLDNVVIFLKRLTNRSGGYERKWI